jgi:hypothetical protein
MHAIGPITRVDQVMARTDAAGVGSRPLQNLPVLIRQLGTTLKLLN